MKAVIIDDESHCIKTLKWTLKEYCPEVDVVGIANDGAEGINVIKNYQPDLVFLDVEMPVMNGIEMLTRFDTYDFDVVFTTAYDQYAVKAIKLNALDYLLKPIDKDDLRKAVDKYKNKEMIISKPQVECLRQSQKVKQVNKIALSLSSELQFINLEDLIRIEADGNYSSFIVKDGKRYLSSKKLGDAEELLSEVDSFFRVHKSHIINLKYVEKYVREDCDIIMKDGTCISLARSKKEEFLNIFGVM
jgi:two-component system, LytTR family, response regulator